MAEKVTIGNCELWHGDCREVLPLLPPCDLILTDPPYGIGIAANPVRHAQANPGDGTEMNIQLTHEDLRKWGESLDKESRNSLGKRLILYADHWRAEVTAEREACAKQCEMRADSLTEGYGVAHQCARDIRARGAK